MGKYKLLKTSATDSGGIPKPFCLFIDEVESTCCSRLYKGQVNMT